MNLIQKFTSVVIGPNRCQPHFRRIPGLLVLIPIFVTLVGLMALAAGPERTQAQGPAQTPDSVKVAVIGDAGVKSSARAVLQLIEDQGAEFVLHPGDFGYGDEDAASARAWNDQVNSILGADYPYFGSIGNHDVDAWPTYQGLFQDRLAQIPGAVCQQGDGGYGINTACHYKGIFFILSGVGTRGSGHVEFIEDQLAQDDSVWRICAWHKNQRAMQVGSKKDEVGWGAYESCRMGGAIIATAHEHSYVRTKTLTDISNQVVDPDWPDRNNVRVIPGSTFVFVSALGGKSLREQERCLPATYPYGCNGEWANIYTTNQGAMPGALFIEFNFGGDPHLARGQFINIDGVTIDEFMITTAAANTAPLGDAQQVNTVQDTARAITLTGSDPDGDTLTFRIVTGPSQGTLSGTLPDLTYAPDPNFIGSDSFTFVANDGMADSAPAMVAITVSPIQADLSFGLLQDPEDGAAGLELAITRVFDPSTNTDVATAWGEYQGKLTYDGTCVNILDFRSKDFSVAFNPPDNGAGVAEFQGTAISGASGPSQLTQVLARLVGSSQNSCDITVEITGLTDDGGDPIGVVPPSLTMKLLRGDALADETVNIADAMFVAQYLAGMRPPCATVVDNTCLHSLNAASWLPDGDFDRVTISDAISIAQHLLGFCEVF